MNLLFREVKGIEGCWRRGRENLRADVEEWKNDDIRDMRLMIAGCWILVGDIGDSLEIVHYNSRVMGHSEM